MHGRIHNNNNTSKARENIEKTHEKKQLTNWRKERT